MVAIGDRIGRALRTVAVLGVGLAGGAVAVAVATVPDSSGAIHACLAVSVSDSGTGTPLTNGPNLTVIDPSAGQTCDGLGQPLSWNVAGPPGPRGKSGTLTLGSVVPKTLAPGIGLVTVDPGKQPWSFPILSFTRVNNAGDIAISKAHDSLSARLAVAFSSGKHFDTVRISIYKRPSGRRPYLIITIKRVVISSLEVSSSPKGPSLETLILSYSKIRSTYP